MKTAFITGGSRGIGAAMVRLFRAHGYLVGFTYLKSEETARALCAETGAVGFCCDTRNEEAVLALHRGLPAHFQSPDVLIVNAGVSYSGLLQEMTSAAWDDLFAVHVRGAFLFTRACLPGMIFKKSGAILYISSMWGQAGASCEVAYSAAKAALLGMTKALAKEVGPSGIRVNCIAPGVIQTDMLAEYTQADLDALKEETPLLRLGKTDDVAQAALFLCGEGASFITGQVLSVNGGFVL